MFHYQLNNNEYTSTAEYVFFIGGLGTYTNTDPILRYKKSTCFKNFYYSEWYDPVGKSLGKSL